MSLYHIVGVALFLGALYEYATKRTPKKLYYCLFLIMIAMLIFRYGQGTDYFGYYYLYQHTPATKSISDVWNSEMHGEVGWKLLCAWSKYYKIEFETFVAYISVVEGVLLWRFVQKHCGYKILALLLAYHTLYLTYMYSALRQGLVVLIFLGILLDFYLHKKYAQYIVGTLVCITIHTSAAAFLAVFVVKFLKLNTLKQMILGVLLSWTIGIFLSTKFAQDLLKSFFPNRVIYYMGEINFSIAILERMVSYAVVLCFFEIYRKRRNDELDSKILLFQKLYTIATMFYGAALWNSLIASRLLYAFKVLEIGIVTLIIKQIGKSRNVLMLFCCVLSFTMWIKNIDSYLVQGGYLKEYNIWNYPYISIFESEDISKYRYVGLMELIE